MRQIAFSVLMAAALSQVALTAAENPNLAPRAEITAIRTVHEAKGQGEATDKPAVLAPTPTIGLDQPMEEDDGLEELVGDLSAPAADKPAAARLSRVESDDVGRGIVDGLLPGPGNRDDRRSVWCIKGEQDLPASLVFTWKAPVTVSTVVYYGRSRAWGFQVFKDYAVYLDDAEKPVVEGTFRNGHGPQPVALPAPASVRKLRLEFRSQHGGDSGATEVQIFSKPPAQSDLLGHFTDLSRDFRYAYYPSHNLVRIYLPQPPADSTAWHLALRPEAGGKVLAERAGKLPMAAGGEAMPVPDLPAGDYLLTLTLTGGAQPIVEERSIGRDRHEWEGNQLGRDEVVIPPFTPLTVDEKANRVGCVLRSHEHGAAGLWSQVVSQERELLAGPVRLEVTQGGKVHTAAGPAPRFTVKKPTAVSGEAAWTAGPLSGTTRFEYDYDGMQTITLELAPTETEVERVQLVIPLKASEAWLMHPVTTGLRQHFAGRIPALSPAEGPALPEGSAAPSAASTNSGQASSGQVGKVWDSSYVPNRLNGNFVPYIYLGGPERGICFAADNDRDWISDSRQPLRGGAIAQIPVNSPPTRQDRIPTAATKVNVGESYGQRLRGTVRPKVDGQYQFLIAGDDQCELRLTVPGSEDSQPMRIAHVPGWTNPGEWKKFPEQTSKPIALKAGAEYAIEILHKEDIGGDHVAVAWTGPGIANPVILGAAGSGAVLTALDGKPGLSRDYWEAETTAPIEIDRDGETVNLRFNLVAVPSRLDRLRRITFALQATPAKPMPETPYNWRRWWATRTDPDVEGVGINFWGGNMYWGGREFATSVYPDGKDFGFWEKLAEQRRTGKLDKAYLDQWLAKYDGLPPDQQGHVGAMRAGFEWSHFTPANSPETTRFHYVIPYTNPRGASGETSEFLGIYLDEWLAGDIVDPAWAHRSPFERPRRVLPGQFPGWASWYQVEPVPSRIDMLLFYHRKMLETFADGIYWDNFFLQENYAPAEAGGPGYVDDAGRPRAGVNLMGFRKLVKRTATMMHVMGKRPLTYIHMTNVNIVPMLAFGTANLDWEWRDQGGMGSMDLQDRIGLDEILAHHLGLQAGNLSVGITGNILKGGGGISREWLHRTGMAVCFPHEIRMHEGTPEVTFAQTQLAKFGYGQKDCRVYRYWDAGFPLRSEGAEMRALVLARGGKAMIALGHFGPAEAAKPAARPGGPSLEEYDAQQRGLKTPAQAPATDAAAAGRQAKQAVYTVRLALDLAALGVAESAQAWDVELKAGRTKAENPAAAKLPELPDVNLDPRAGDEPGLELEEKNPALLKRLGPGVFEVAITHHDFALIVVE